MSVFKAESSSESSQTRLYGLEDSDDQLDFEAEQKSIDRSGSLEPFEVMDKGSCSRTRPFVSNKANQKTMHEQALMAQLMTVAQLITTTTQKVKEMANLENLLKDEAGKMKAEIKNMKKEAEKMAGENATLKANLENLLKSTEDEARKMKAEIENKDANSEKMAGENEMLKQQIEQCRKDLADSENRYRETNASLEECRKSLETANREKVRMKQQFVITRKEQGSKYSTIIEKYKTEMRLKDAELETCKKNAKKRLDFIEQCLAGRDQKLDNSAVKIHQMEQKTSELQAKIGELEAEKKQNADKNDTLVKELQTELEKCRQELEKAANAQSHAYRTLTNLLPQLAPSETEKELFSVPAHKFTSLAPPDSRKRSSFEKQCDPEPSSAENSQNTDEKKRQWQDRYKRTRVLSNLSAES